ERHPRSSRARATHRLPGVHAVVETTRESNELLRAGLRDCVDQRGGPRRAAQPRETPAARGVSPGADARARRLRSFVDCPLRDEPGIAAGAATSIHRSVRTNPDGTGRWSEGVKLVFDLPA